MKKCFLIFVLAMPLLAKQDAIIDCGKAFVFREEADHFILEVEEPNKSGSLVGVLLAAPPDGKTYRMKVRIVRLSPYSTRPLLNCLFHKTEPLLVHCNQAIIEEQVELTEVASGVTQTVEVLGLMNRTQLVEREAVVDFDTTEKQRFLELYVDAWTANTSGTLKIELEAAQCKAGTPATRPPVL